MESGFRLTLAALCAVSLVQCRPACPRTNLLLIVTDTLRADALACYGGSAHTPNICGLAERGVLFEVAYANAPWTPPSAASIFTGNYPTAYANLSSGPSYAPSFWVSDEEVPLGEASVLAQVVTGHRDQAFEACRLLIDRLKATAPTWKREMCALMLASASWRRTWLPPPPRSFHSYTFSERASGTKPVSQMRSWYSFPCPLK